MFKYFIKSYRVTFLLVAGIALLGASSMLNLPREATPEIQIPVGVVVTAYPGASAVNVEELVTKPIEDGVSSIEGIDNVTSSSRLGVSSVTVTFQADQDVKDSIRRLREAADKVTGLPDDAEQPQVIEVSFTDQAIISLSLTGIQDRKLLSNYAKDLADDIKSIADVSSVRIVGESTDEVVVSIDPNTLTQRGVSIGQITGALRASNINAPLGQLETTDYQYNLRLAAGYDRVSDVAQTRITLPDGSTVQLQDIAHVALQASEPGSTSFVSTGGSKATPAVTLEVRKRTGGNIVSIVDKVTARAQEFKDANLPADINIVTFADNAQEIRKSLSDVSRSGVQTFVIVFVILWLFLGWKEASLASLSVPITFLTAFIIFQIFDITLNNISLFSLILSLGLLVDTAIVITDGIHVHVAQKSENLEEDAYGVVKKFVKPLTSGVLTTVAAFFPMLLVSGIIGQFLRTIPIVISASLLAALVISLLVLPAVGVRIFTRWPKVHASRKFVGYFDRFRDWYSARIAKLLVSRRQQNILIGVLSVLLVLGLSLPFTGLLRTGLFPAADVDFVLGNIELDSGAKLGQTEAALLAMQDKIKSIPEVKSFALNAGSGTSADIGGGSSGSNLGSFYINLKEDRKRSSDQVSEALRKSLTGFPGVDVSVLEVSAGPPTAAPIEVRLASDSLDDLKAASEKVSNYLRAQTGVVDIKSSADSSANEFVLTLNRERLAQNGLTASDVAGTLRQVVFSGEVTNFLNPQADEIKVKLATDDTIKTPNGILDLPLLTRSNQVVRVRDIANLEAAPALTSIRHRDSKREVSVTADVEGDTNANEVSQKIVTDQASLGLPPGVTLAVGGEQQETEKTFAELYRSMFLAVIAIAVILVIEFDSYKQPLLIILAIPMALIGVLFGLLITRGQLNFAAFIGLVSLAGIVVNNAILLVDQANTHINDSYTPEEAMKEATASRLRPIILTTLTTAAGVAPLIFVDAFFRDMALTIITGLLFSTILTLALIPVLYVRQQNKKLRKQGLL